MLSPERKGLITASIAPKIVHGSGAERFQLWMEMVGSAEPEDLSGVYPVQHGKHCEPFVLDWIERTTQHEISERGRFCRHPTLPIGATLDGYRPFDDAVVECKVLSPFSDAESVGNSLGFRDYYRPQVVVQMHCRPAARGWLAVQTGNSGPQLYEIERDEVYEAGVLDVLTQFHGYVARREPPSPAPPAPVPPERWRTIDLNADHGGQPPNWVPALRTVLDVWQDTRGLAAQHEQAKKDVKLLLPDDMGRVSYGAISIRRARNGAVTIEEKAA